MQPIGTTAMQLNRDHQYASGKQNQLSYWQQHGLLNGLPALNTIDKFPGIDDQSQSLDNRARAYLDVNCGTCHHPQGPANTSGLFLHYEQDPTVRTGYYEKPCGSGSWSWKKFI